MLITKYGSTLYIGMDEVFQHHAHTFEKAFTFNVNSVLLLQMVAIDNIHVYLKYGKNFFNNNRDITKS